MTWIGTIQDNSLSEFTGPPHMLKYSVMTAESQHVIALIPGLGNGELLLILFIILLLFGAKKLPELARGLGKSMREFKKATSDIEEDFRSAMDEKSERPAAPKSPPPPAAPPTAPKTTES